MCSQVEPLSLVFNVTSHGLDSKPCLLFLYSTSYSCLLVVDLNKLLLSYVFLPLWADERNFCVKIYTTMLFYHRYNMVLWLYSLNVFFKSCFYFLICQNLLIYLNVLNRSEWQEWVALLVLLLIICYNQP